MIEQFQGPDGESRLRQVLLRSHLVEGNKVVADAFVKGCELREFVAGESFIRQDEHDHDLFMIVSGHVQVWINGRMVADRGDRQHVGELALICHGVPRSATVTAKTLCVVAKISDNLFRDLAEKFPRLWRILAMDIADRLRERGKYIYAPNAQPQFFVGCASEGLAETKAIIAGFASDPYTPRLWEDNVFVPGHGTLEDLEAVIKGMDFGVLVCTKDDHVTNAARGVDKMAPRDNVILELGMCVGALGRKRTFIVKPEGQELKIPSDYNGTTIIQYKEGIPLDEAMKPVCEAIRRVVALEKMR